MKLVFIEWTDAIGCGAGWQDDVSLDSYNGNCYTCGILLDENEDWYMVAGHVTADLKQSQGALEIPKAMVTRKVDLEVP
jgi:hypothetical protein